MNRPTLAQFLHFCGGSPVTIVANMDPSVRRRHTTRGVVFLVNFVFLTFVWSSIGWRYLGPIGLICPGLVMPTLLVLGFGRLIAMQPWLLRGELALYNIEGMAESHKGLYWLPRVITAAVVSTLTTLLLLIALNQNLLRERALEASREANTALSTEYVNHIEAVSNAQLDEQNTQREETAEALQRAKDALSTATRNRADAEAKLSEADRQQHAEAGGLDGRAPGKKQRFRAWQAQAEDTAKDVQRENDRVTKAQGSVDTLTAQLAAIDNKLAGLQGERKRQLDEIPGAITQDPRYVPPLDGIFYDATLFLGLYGDRKLGPGLATFTVLLIPVLFSIELSDLIAILLSRCPLTMVAESLRVRVEIAKLVSRSESQIAAAYAGGQGNLRIVPARGAEGYPGQDNIPPQAEEKI